MLKLPLLASALLLTAATDTVWWRSDAGTVIGHRTGSGVTCTLTLHNGPTEMRFAWSTGLPTRAIVQRADWQFQPGNMLDIAVQVGAVWLGRGDGAPNIPAMTGPSSLMFVANDDVEDLLRQTPRVQISTQAATAGITVPEGKMQALARALDRCRALIRSSG